MNSENRKLARTWTWIPRISALLLFIGACSSHFFPFEDPFVPTERTERKQLLKFDTRPDSEVKAEIAKLWSGYESDAEQLELSPFNEPATDEQIAELENLVGSPLPADFKAFLKIHNGGHGFYSVAEMVTQYKRNISIIEFEQSADLQLTQNNWHPGLVVFRGSEHAIQVGTGCVVQVRPASKPYNQISIPNHDTFAKFLEQFRKIQNQFYRLGTNQE